MLHTYITSSAYFKYYSKQPEDGPWQQKDDDSDVTSIQHTTITDDK